MSEMSLEDQQAIEFAQKVRKEAIKELVSQGAVPKNPADKVLLLGLLDGTDRSVLARARLKADENSSKNQAAIQAMMAEALNNMPQVQRRAVGTVLQLPNTYEITDIVPGETDIQTEALTYDTFMKVPS